MPLYIMITISVLCFLYTIWLYFNVLKRNKQLKAEVSSLKQENETTEERISERYQSLFQAWCVTKEKEIRKDSVERSRNIIRGQATEHLAPMMMEGLSLKDYRFMGNPIDFIVFNGLGDVSDKKKDKLDSVIFLDIKTGNSRLNKVQRRIRDCILEGRVEFMVYNPDKENKNE